MYRFSLRRKPQIKCPSCGQRKFSPYIDNLTGVPLAEELCGRCSRENNCNYHMPPRELFEEYPEYLPDDGGDEVVESYVVRKETSLMEQEDLINTLTIKDNSLISFLQTVLPEQELNQAIEEYFIGFTESMIIFWQIDIDGDIRTGKKMLYEKTGKRDKKHLYLMHKEIYDADDFVVKECYFGEHLILQHPEKDISIVESEKSAFICSIIWLDQIWLSTGGKNKWLESSWPALQGRHITLIPDEDAITDWEEMMSEMRMQNLDVSIDKICEGRDPQSDIADILLNDGFLPVIKEIEEE